LGMKKTNLSEKSSIVKIAPEGEKGEREKRGKLESDAGKGKETCVF